MEQKSGSLRVLTENWPLCLNWAWWSILGYVERTDFGAIGAKTPKQLFKDLFILEKYFFQPLFTHKTVIN